MNSLEGIGTDMHRSKGGIFLKLQGFLSLRLFPTCRDCPQYGQAIIYGRKCYYQKMCALPVRLQISRLNRILAQKVKDAKDFSLSMYGEPRCPDDKHHWKEVMNQPKHGLSVCENCGQLKEWCVNGGVSREWRGQ